MKVRTQAPIRISLLGGGTDVGEYAEKYGGVCVNMAINIRQKFTLDSEHSNTSLVRGDSKDFIRSFVPDHIGVKHEFDGFIHGGLGTSASAAVALISGLSRMIGINFSRRQIAESAWEAEVGTLGMFGGKQDQYCATFGGFNSMYFRDDVEVLRFDRDVAEDHAKNILLFDTGIRRKDKDIQEGLKKISSKQKAALDNMKSIAMDAYTQDLGKLLDDNWRYKKESNNVSTPDIDHLYDKGKKLGAVGGKLCGSGGGGYMIFYVPKERQVDFKKDIGIRWVDYSIDWQGVDSRIL